MVIDALLYMVGKKVVVNKMRKYTIRQIGKLMNNYSEIIL